MRLITIVALPLLWAAGRAEAQTAGPAPETPRKRAHAVRLEAGGLELDGRLAEAVWRRAEPITDFVQKHPDEGAAPSERTEVRFAYDEDALYVGARMHSKDPRAIQAPVTRRDQVMQAEHIVVSLDTYLDRRTAYGFGVTAAGTRLDEFYPADVDDSDEEYDPVWEARVATDSLGWTAELRIPFSQLRFTAKAAQVWGLNVRRWIPSKNEDVYWSMVPRNVSAWASRFGDLGVIEGIRPSRRLELLPYAATRAVVSSTVEAGDPFRDDVEAGLRAGADLKMGLGPNLTLDATVNPDFGQVEADPAEVNLSAYETFFDERRPFFLEGSDLLEGGGAGYFYSRRIGAAPRGGAPGDFTDVPEASTILGAAKVTGRLQGGLSVGALAALTGRERARTFDAETGAFGSVDVEPTTGYGVARVQQQFGAAGSTVGLILTGVKRDLEEGHPLGALLGRQAVTGGADWNLRFRGGEYVLRGNVGFSHVAGDPAAMLRLQRSSARYFQRPDADHVELDSTRTSLSGYTASLSFSRRSGRHWLGNVFLAARTPGFELNDAGALGSTDAIDGFLNVRYRETQAKGPFRSFQVGLNSENLWDFGAVRNFSALRTDMSFTWKNFWTTNVTAWLDLRSQDASLTRGGPLMGTGRAWVGIVQLANASSAQTGWNGRVYYGRNELGELTYRLSGGFSLRPGPRWRLSVSPNWLRSISPRQYVAVRPGGRAATFGQRYVFSFIDRGTFSAPLRLNYTLTPDLTLELYAEPFAASGRYYDFGELAAARSRDLRFYGEAGTAIEQRPDRSYLVRDGAQTFMLPFRDFNVRSFRSNAVLRWEWRRGSTLYAVWQQDRSEFSPEGELIGPGALFETFGARGDHVLAFKLAYWLPVR